jgi:hypothetical protein
MRRSGVGSGGGYGSNKNVSTPVRTGSGSREVHPGYAGQLGQAQGSHVTGERDSSYRGEKMYGGRGMNPVPYGNQVALNVKGGGPGTGRTIYHCGTQDQHGNVAGSPKPAGQDILRSYGPESSRPRNNE